MQVIVNVVLSEGDEMTMTAAEMAEAVLTALNGNPDKDLVSASIQQVPEMASAGSIPLAPEAPEPPPVQ